MKRVTCSSYFFHFCFFFCLTLTACAAKRSATKAVSERETASVTESRLSFYRTIDSLSRQFNLSADSISIIFTEFPTAYPSGMVGCAETPSNSIRAPRTPHKVKVYGLHLNENIEKKSIANADLKDSVNKFTQSENIKSSSKQSSKPSNTPKYIFYILLLAIGLHVIYRIRRS